MAERDLTPDEYDQWICDEISAVLRRLKREQGIGIERVKLDMKSCIVDVFIDRPLPQHLTTDDMICREHFCGITWK